MTSVTPVSWRATPLIECLLPPEPLTYVVASCTLASCKRPRIWGKAGLQDEWIERTLVHCRASPPAMGCRVSPNVHGALSMERQVGEGLWSAAMLLAGLAHCGARWGARNDKEGRRRALSWEQLGLSVVGFGPW